MKTAPQKILSSESLEPIGKTLFYSFVVAALIHLYHYKNINEGAFIYNKF